VIPEFEAYQLGDGDFTLNVLERTLLQGAQRVPLSGKPFDLLVYLVQAHPRAIQNQDLENRFGRKGLSMSRNALKAAFTPIYKALGDPGNKLRRYIERNNEFTKFVGPIRSMSATGHGVMYSGPDEYGFRLRQLLTLSSRKRRLFIAMGELRFFSAWLPRNKNLVLTKISGLVLLGLHPVRAKRFEKQEKLRPKFTRTMTDNIESLWREIGLPIEHRVWPAAGKFHGFIYGDVALTGEWATDDEGYSHVHTGLVETHRDRDSKFGDITNAFSKSAQFKVFPAR